MVFGQRDYNEELGTGTGATIAQYGCALTCVASLLVNCFGKDTDPSRLNQALISVSGFASNGAGAVDLLDWTAINKIYSDVSLAFNNWYPSSPADMSLIDSQLQKGESVVAGVDFNHSVNATSPSHYVEIYKKNSDDTYQCRDPWYKDDTSFNARYAVSGMSVSECILQAVSYNGIVSAQDSQKTLDDLRAARDNNWNLYQSELTTNADLSKQVSDLTKQAGDAHAQVTQLETENATVNTQAASLADELKKLHEDDSNVGLRNTDLSHKLDAATLLLSEHYKDMGATDEATYIDAIRALKQPHEEVVKQVQPTIEALAQAAIAKQPVKTTKKNWFHRLFG